MKKKRVFVGLSGGVDSSVAAWRLMAEGYEVVGVFIKVWHPDFLICDWEAERLDAMRVAAHLGIPFLTCDATQAYKQEVADYFIAEYQAGRTPNPDVMCNKAVKFGAFLDFANSHQADYVATGHYAQNVRDEQSHHTLLRGVDQNKDQSYFLWTLNQKQLAQVLLPVGKSEKSQIREEATKAGIPTALKKDSQGVCFLGHIDIPDFLSHYIHLTPGPVINRAGEIVGEHRGVFVYTLGQRHGFTLHQQTTAETPYYVVGKEVENNTLVVDTTPAVLAATTAITLTDYNLINDTPLPDALTAQVRYRQAPFAVTCTKKNERSLELLPHEAVELPAAGQSCVLYDGTICLGGGIIA